jgi:hypothetical protein
LNQNTYSQHRDHYKATWAIKLTLIPMIGTVANSDGKSQYSYLHVDLDFDMSKEEYFKVTSVLDHVTVLMNGHDTFLKERLTDNLNKQINWIIGNLRSKFDVIGRFSYPGNGHLFFDNPVIGKFGDLNAQVRYKP